MANYKHAQTSYAMQKIREMFDLGRELNQQIALCKQKYSPNVAQNMIEEMLQQYRDANEEARKAVAVAASAARARVESAMADTLQIGNAEEDFKLLALPVTLSRDELRALVKRNEGNVLFARAVSQYAEDHEYNDQEFRVLSVPRPYKAHLTNINDAEAQLMRYCEPETPDAIDWQAMAFSTVDNLGLYENL